jgi:hypothetical protein
VLCCIKCIFYALNIIAMQQATTLCEKTAEKDFSLKELHDLHKIFPFLLAILYFFGKKQQKKKFMLSTNDRKKVLNLFVETRVTIRRKKIINKKRNININLNFVQTTLFTVSVCVGSKRERSKKKVK